MVLKLNEFRDKLAGCWAGKNVGGVLGAPFECKRMVPDVDFYIQDLSMGPPANDDLDWHCFIREPAVWCRECAR